MSDLNTFLRILSPQNTRFYVFFEQMIDKTLAMANTLQQMVQEPDNKKHAPFVENIVRLENECDDISHKISTELSRSFITPFDREDIHYLTNSLDDVADYIYSSAKKINFYHIDTIDEDIHKLAAHILECIVYLKIAVYGIRDLKDMKKLTNAIARIDALENDANDIFDAAIHHLFEKETNFKQLILCKELFQTMEAATNKAKDASNVIESIIIKYG